MVMALNAEAEKWWWWLWKSNWEVITTLNVETKDATLNVNLKTDDGSERRTENTVMALNAETKKWWWLWTPKLRSDDDDSERQTE